MKGKSAKRVFVQFARSFCIALMGVIASCVSIDSAQIRAQKNTDLRTDYGVLLMAHGGSDVWNRGVEDSLNHLRSLYPTEIAFGMADAGSIENAVRKLEAEGVKHVGVVRLFISGESWYERTAQILGIEEGAPPKSADHSGLGHTAMPMGFWQIASDLRFYLSEEGLAEAEEMDQVLLSRVRGLSLHPAKEVVAIIAHGPADDEENSRWVSEIAERAELMQAELNVDDVQVFTLREDWEEKREGAEELIRKYVQQANANSLTAIVVPFRVQGFGPYASVLEGLDYHADQLGLIPHSNVALWIKNQAEALRVEAQTHKNKWAASTLTP